MSDYEGSSFQTVGMSLRFDVTADPNRLAVIQEMLASVGRVAGGSAVSIGVGFPETYPSGAADEKLDMPIAQFLNGQQRSLLEIQGLRTARDLLVVGTGVIDEVERNATLLHTITSRFQASPFPMAIRERPTVEQVAGLCSGLDQVVLQAASGALQDWMFRDREQQSNRITVQDALDDTAKFRVILQTDYYRDKAREAAADFAENFLQAKERQG